MATLTAINQARSPHLCDSCGKPATTWHKRGQSQPWLDPYMIRCNGHKRKTKNMLGWVETTLEEIQVELVMDA